MTRIDGRRRMRWWWCSDAVVHNNMEGGVVERTREQEDCASLGTVGSCTANVPT